MRTTLRTPAPAADPDVTSLRIRRATKERLDVVLAQRREETGYTRYSVDNLVNDLLTLWEAENVAAEAPQLADVPPRLSKAMRRK